MRTILLVVCAITIPQLATAQTKIDWTVLSDVKFRQKLIKEYNSVYLLPKFGKQPKAYAGKEVMITGYLIPLSADFSQLVLSKTPYASCFFCGQSGPDTVVELELSPDSKRRFFRMDDFVEVTGTFSLSKNAAQSLPYKLTNARMEKRE
ncbi:MAG: DUF3299 domain-containing protein [Cyanothece sp. SIO1E1]|nr:DUF3299 domain-containing protein [Cyanothece sp. SIO1E1]